MASPFCILLVDDRAPDRELAVRVLSGALPHLRVEPVGDALAFAEHLAEGDFDLVVSERRLGWSDGLDLLATVKRRSPRCPVLFFAANVSPEDALVGRQAGLDELVPKSSAGFLRLPEVVAAHLERAAAKPDDARQVIDRLPVGVVRLDDAGLIVSHNGACARLLGSAESARLEGTPLAHLLEGEETVARVRKALEREYALADTEVAVRGLDGREQWVRLSLSPIAGGFDGTLEDIGPYKRRERELTRRGDELDRFAYMASHELQEPLGLIGRYGTLIRERLRGQGDHELEGYLAHLLESSRRSQALVEDLLTYARIGSRGRPFEPVEFGAALEAAAANLHAQFEATGGSLQHGPLPTLAADGGQVIQLFQNLLSNALKFHGARPPEIAVSASETASGWRFEVRDRGIGIDPVQQPRIFEMFQRLHTAEEYPGTGIGLAICKAIVERHGGEIDVVSRPGEGSIFIFTLPH